MSSWYFTPIREQMWMSLTRLHPEGSWESFSNELIPHLFVDYTNILLEQEGKGHNDE